MSEVTVEVSPDGEPAVVTGVAPAADSAELGLAAGAALVTAETAGAVAEEALAVAAGAADTADAALSASLAMESTCCEHCYAHKDRLDRLEAEPAPVVVVGDDDEVEVFDAPAPEAREPRRRSSQTVVSPPVKKSRSFWPI